MSIFYQVLTSREFDSGSFDGIIFIKFGDSYSTSELQKKELN